MKHVIETESYYNYTTCMPILCLSDKSYPTVPAFSENPFISTRAFCFRQSDAAV